MTLFILFDLFFIVVVDEDDDPSFDHNDRSDVGELDKFFDPLKEEYILSVSSPPPILGIPVNDSEK